MGHSVPQGPPAPPCWSQAVTRLPASQLLISAPQRGSQAKGQLGGSLTRFRTTCRWWQREALVQVTPNPHEPNRWVLPAPPSQTCPTPSMHGHLTRALRPHAWPPHTHSAPSTHGHLTRVLFCHLMSATPLVPLEAKCMQRRWQDPTPTPDLWPWLWTIPKAARFDLDPPRR